MLPLLPKCTAPDRGAEDLSWQLKQMSSQKLPGDRGGGRREGMNVILEGYLAGLSFQCEMAT